MCIRDRYAVALAGNAADPAHQAAAIELAHDRFGGLDYLVNNTGINPAYGPLLDTPTEVARKILDTNVVAAAAWVKAAIDRGLGSAAHPGAVVNIASIAGLGASGALGWYAVSKAALIHLTMELGLQLGPDVRVNAVAPAVVKTRFAEALYGASLGAMEASCDRIDEATRSFSEASATSARPSSSGSLASRPITRAASAWRRASRAGCLT